MKGKIFHGLALLLVVSALPLGCCKKITGKGSDDGDGEAGSEPKSAPVKASKDKPAAKKKRAPAKALPFAVGQWVEYRRVAAGQPEGTIKYALVGKEGDAWVFEATTTKPPTAVRLVMKVNDERHLESSELRSAKVRLPNGRVQSLSGAMLRAFDYKKMLGAYKTPDFANGKKETVRVPAGKFSDCLKTKETVTFRGKRYPATIWRHTTVPVLTLVKSISDKDGSVMELKAFGTKGAKSAF